VSTERLALIRNRLETSLHPTTCEVIDESHLHRGHAGARDGRGHFRLRIASPALRGLRRLEAHRRVYEALGPLMQTDIHAVAIELVD
jgi:BolA protein